MKQSLLTYLLSSLVRNIRQGISTFNARIGQVLHGSLSALGQQNGITFSRTYLTRCALVVALLMGSVNVWGAEASVELCVSWGSTQLAYGTTYTHDYTIDNLNGGTTTLSIAALGVYRDAGTTNTSFQMNKKEGHFKNTNAFPGKITRIVTTWSATKNPTKCYFAESTEASSSDEVVNVSANQSVTYTPPTGADYYYFNIDVKSGSGVAKMTSCIVYYESSDADGGDEPSGKEVTYTLTSSLTDGDYVFGAINGSASTDNVIGAANATADTWGGYTKVTPSNGVITTADNTIVWTLTNLSEGGFTLKNKSSNKYIVLGSGTTKTSYQLSDEASTIYASVAEAAQSTFELHQSSTATASDGNQLGLNYGSGYGYRMYAHRDHATTSGGIATQIRFYKADDSGSGSNCTTPTVTTLDVAESDGWKVGTPYDLSDLFESNNSNTVSFSCSQEGCNISGNSFTATKVGTYTISAHQDADGTYCEVNETFDVVVSAIVNFSVNGTILKTQTLSSGKPTAPADPTTSDCDNLKVFVGWTTGEIAVATDTEPTLYSSAEIPAVSGNATYYAVFANAKIGEDIPRTWTDYTAWGGESDQNSWLRNNNATLPTFTYTPTYAVSKIVLNVRQSNATGSNSIEVQIAGNTFGTKLSSLSQNDSHDVTFEGTTPQSGEIKIICTNTSANSTKQGTFFLNSITVYESGTDYEGYITKCSPIDESLWHNITLNVSPAGATGCLAQAGTDRVYDTGTTTLTATVGAGYTFAGWDVTSGTAEIENATSTSATLKNITTTDVTVTANFIEGTYHLVTADMPALTAGDELLMASYWEEAGNNKNVVAGDISGNRLQMVNAAFSEDKKIVACLPAGHTIFTLGGEAGAYTLQGASGYLTAPNATNDLAWNSTAATWDITIGDDNNATMTSNGRYLAANLGERYMYFIAAEKASTDEIGTYHVQLYRKYAVCSLTATLNTITYPLNSTALDVKSLTATYTDGKTTKTLALTDANVEHSAIDFTTTGTKKVTFSYTEDGRTVTTPEYTITVYDPNEKYTVTFYNMGAPYGEAQTLSSTEMVTKPADPQATGDCEGRVFYGWSTEEIEGDAIEKPTTIIEDVTTLKATTNLYAVYADVTVDHTAKYTATQITSESDLEDGGLYMIVQSERAAINSISNKALVTTTNYNLTNLEGNEPYVWKFVMDGAGYIIYSSADNTQKIGLVNTGDTDINLTTSTIWYITYATDRFKIQASTNTKRYLKYNADNNYKAYSNNTFTPDETNNIQLYKLTQGVAYSHFSTSCACNTIPTLTIDLPTEDAFPVSGDYMVELKTQGGNGNPAIQWSINSKDAKIDDSGHLVAIAPGEYEITAKQLRYDHKCTEIATHTIELTAPTASFALTFINNGKTHEIKIVEWGQYVSRPTTPVAPTTCSEYKFVGWSTTNDVLDVTKFAFYDFSQRVKADATLYAVYSTETCAATYDKYTLDGEQAVTSGDLSYKYILTSPDGTYAMLGTSTASGDGIRVGALGQGTAPTTLTNPSPRFVWDVTQESTGSTYDNYSFYNQYTGKYLGVENGQFVLSTEKKVLQMYYDEFGRFNLGDYITDDSNEAPTFSWDTSEKPDYSHAITMKTYSNAVGFCFYQRTCKVDISKYTLDICEPACEDIPTITRTSSAANSVTIAWDCTAETAKVVLYSDAGGTQVVEEAKVTAKTHTFGELQAETKYYVRVFAGEDQTCESALQAITTTESTLDIVDWGTYNNGKVGITINLTDAAAAKVSVGEEKVITNESTNESLVQELFFSKYYEAAGSIKLIGIYNPTNAPISLAGYHVYVQTKEYFSDAQHHFALNEHDTEIPAGTEYIFYHDGRYAGTKTSYEGDLNNPDYLVDADGTTLGNCISQTINGELGETDGSGVNRPGWFLESACDWGGKHSIALFKNGNLIDIIGAYDGDLDRPGELKATTSNQKDAFPAGDFPEEEYGTFQDDLNEEQTAWFAGGERYDPQEGEPKLCVLSTNRCLLIRKRNIKYDLTLNDGDFGALSKEWLGRPVGTSTDKAADRYRTCTEFSAVSSFDYAKYYITYETVVDNQELSGMTNTDGTYTIPIDNIADLACKNIKIDLLDNSDKAVLSQEVRVPIIIESTTTTNGTQFTALGKTTEESAETCRTCDVVVKNDAVLTHADNAIPQIGNLIVQDGAKLKIADDKKFTVASVTLRSEKDVVPHLILPSNTSELESKAKSLRFTKRIPNDRYYFFSLPFDCNVDDIMLSNGEKAVHGTDILIKYYDGAHRATNGTGANIENWKVIDPTEPLVAGQGYALAVATDNPIEVVFPMTFTSTALHIEDNNNKAVAITAHGFDADGNNISGRTPNNIGWNFVGNPYFTHYGTLADTDLKHGKIEVVDGVVGETWIDETNLYVNIPDAGQDQLYTQKTATSTTLSPFFPFFVQVAKTGTLEYAPATRVPAAIAARNAVANDKPVFVGVSLSNGTTSDETSLVINDRFTQAYEVGFDLEKLLGFGQKPQVYVRDEAYRYAFKALNESDAAATNMLGVYLPAKEATTYTFDVMRGYDLSRVQGVYLTDHVAGKVTNLLQEPYTFTAEYAYTNNRFSLSVVLAPKAVTSLMDVETAWNVWQDAPQHIRLQGLMVGDDVRVVDATGKLVERLTTTDSGAQFSLPAAGAYCVQVIGVNGLEVRKVVVR